MSVYEGLRALPRLTPSRVGAEPALEYASATTLRVGFVLAAVAVAVQSLVSIFNALALGSRYDALNVDREFNVFSWAGSGATLMAAYAALLLALARLERRRLFSILAALLAFLSLDDMIGIHERVGEKVFVGLLGFSLDTGGRMFPLVYFPLLALVFGLLVAASREFGARIQGAVFTGLACLVLAIFGELLSSALFHFDAITYGSWPDTLEVTIEEGLELGGWVLIASGLSAGIALRLTRALAQGTSSRALP